MIGSFVYTLVAYHLFLSSARHFDDFGFPLFLSWSSRVIYSPFELFVIWVLDCRYVVLLALPAFRSYKALAGPSYDAKYEMLKYWSAARGLPLVPHA